MMKRIISILLLILCSSYHAYSSENMKLNSSNLSQDQILDAVMEWASNFTIDSFDKENGIIVIKDKDVIDLSESDDQQTNKVLLSYQMGIDIKNDHYTTSFTVLAIEPICGHQEKLDIEENMNLRSFREKINKSLSDSVRNYKKNDNKYRLMPYEPSYVICRWADDDDRALNAHYSFKYSLYKEEYKKSDLYLKYIGDFDFYWGSRESDPVVNRVSNPGLHWQLFFDKNSNLYNWIKWVNIGIEHRSNGQTTEVTSAPEAAAAQNAYDNNDRQFFDSISRGANYFSGEVHELKRTKYGDLSFYLKTKLYYISKDSEITWGPLANSGVDISDYDRIILIARYSFKKNNDYKWETSIEWMLGDKYFRHDSLNIDLMIHAKNSKVDIPFYIRCHLGPMFTLSNYTKYEKSFGIGIKLVPF